MSGLTENRKIALAFIVGLVVGVGVTWLWYATEPQQPTNDEMATTTEDGTAIDENGTTSEADTSDDSADSTTDDSAPATEVGNGDSISVTRQVPGDSVSVQSVSFARPGWVVVHEVGTDGELGNALGAKWFPAGEDQQGNVSLLRGTEGEATYTAVLYRDDGDRTFELDADNMITDESGDPVQAQFDTMSGAAGN